MCGFCGFTGHIENREEIIQKMMDRIKHRGPDSNGVHVDENVTLGFNRLSLIDLTDGTQPMYNENGTIVMVFNGEIYNFLELRDKLKTKGHKFKTHSDTETLIHAYEQYGPDMFKHIRGMFAFVIYDYNKQRVFGARDFFGIKPFYYSIMDNEMIFGSEIKSFMEHPKFTPEVNTEALENYLTFQYSVLDETFFKGVYKLPPGHYFTFTAGEFKLKKYWSSHFSFEHQSKENFEAEVDSTLKDSIKMHELSDVEVGSFLSSGVDSSLVAALFNGDKTFTVGFDYDSYNEIDYAKSLSDELGKQNFSQLITTEEYWSSLPIIQYHMDEPLADPAAVALYFVSKLASKSVKACLSGEGADEFFGGYNIYKEPLSLAFINKFPRFIRKFLAMIVQKIPRHFKGKSFFIRASKTLPERFIGNANIFSLDERKRILKNAEHNTLPQAITKKYYDQAFAYDDITKMQYIDINLWMVGDILLKADKMSMANSLEVRVPYLDKRVFKSAAKLPTSLRVNRSGTKLTLRNVAKKYIPKRVANKRKLGFPVPIKIWLRDDKYYNVIKNSFMGDVAQKYFNTDELIKLLDEHKTRDNSRKIWTVYMFIVWHEQFFHNCSAVSK